MCCNIDVATLNLYCLRYATIQMRFADRTVQRKKLIRQVPHSFFSNSMSATQWTLDLNHSEISFKVKHLMIATVTGKFEKYDISLESVAADFSDAKVKFSIDAASINTGIEARDNHLRSDDFFNAEKFPTIGFESSEMIKTADDRYILRGELRIRDVTKVVDFDVELGGSMIDPYGNHKVGFEVSTKVRRKEFNLLWDALTESGGVVVSDEVRLSANIQFQKSAA